MDKKPIKKIGRSLTALVLTSLFAGGCAHNGMYQRQSTQDIERYGAKRRVTEREINKLGNPEKINIMSLGGYVMTNNTLNELRKLGAIVEGQLTVVEISDGKYLIPRGSSYSRPNQETTLRLLEIADRNNDNVVTDQEISELSRKVYERAARR